MIPLRLPDEITTDRLRVRTWRVGDAPLLKVAIDTNLDHLRAWLPWAMHEPSSLESLAGRIERFAADFAAGREWLYAIFSRDGRDLLGGCGLHPRSGPDVLEIGYWLQQQATGLGYATEACRALVESAFACPGIARVEIRCDPANTTSARIPARLGFTHVSTIRGDGQTPNGERRDSMVWQIARDAS